MSFWGELKRRNIYKVGAAYARKILIVEENISFREFLLNLLKDMAEIEFCRLS